MFDRPPYSPSKTLAYLDRRSLQLRQSVYLASVPKQSVENGEQNRFLYLSAQQTDSTRIYQTFDQLESSITYTKTISNVFHKEQKYANYVLNDILPVSLACYYTQQKENTSNEDQKFDLFDSNLPMQEKIRLLRQRPDMLHNFVLEAEKARREQANERQKQRIEHRRAHRQVLGCANLPFVADFYRHNIETLGQRPDYALRGALLNAQIADVQSKKRREAEVAEFNGQKKLMRPRVATILPQIFILQKNKLGVYLYLASRIAAMRYAGAVFQQKTASNMRILRARQVILTNMREKCKINREKAESQAVAVIIRALRHRKIARDKNTRIRALQQLRAFLLAVYQQQTNLGSVAQFVLAQYALSRQLDNMHQKNQARVDVLRCVVNAYAKQSAYSAWRKEKEAFIARQMRILQDPKQSKNLKAFIARYPPGYEPVPDEADEARIAKLQLSDQLCEELCWKIVLRAAESNRDVLNSNFALNSQAGALYINIVNLLPTREYLEHAFDALRKGQYLGEVVADAEVELEAPAPYRGP